MLPGLNGVEVLKRVGRRLPDCRFLVFSGYADATVLRSVLDAGAHGFISKTAPLDELYRGIKVVAEGGTFFSADVANVLRTILQNPTQSANPGLDRLTAREREILQLIAESHTTREIASRLNISVKTAENHRTNLMNKLDLHDVASLTRFAIECGMIEPPVRPLVG
jgi:DNA-binding NarL/FixJ family response regulator